MTTAELAQSIVQVLDKTGIDIGDRHVVFAIATEIAHRIQPEIVRDRAYRIAELTQFGFTPGQIYAARRAGLLVIRKNGRASRVIGSDLLDYIAHMPTLG